MKLKQSLYTNPNISLDDCELPFAWLLGIMRIGASLPYRMYVFAKVLKTNLL